MSEFIGIYGGAFDPPHFSHIRTAKALIAERGYDKLILLPSHNPPHKNLSASDTDRLNMLNLLKNDKMIVSDLEISRQGVGYTADYLPELIKIYGDNIEYIIGGDSFLNFHKWSRHKTILKLSKILVVARNKEKQPLYEKLKEYSNEDIKGIEIAEFMPEEMSSSAIRNKLRLHMPVSDFVDSKVIDYIGNKNIYNEYGELVDKLKINLSEEKFIHTQGVVLFALKYADKLDMDYNKVFLATLLHDCAKEMKNYDEIYAKADLPADSNNTPVAHAFCGSVIAKEVYGVQDDEVLDAIFCHTTAKPNMTELAKLIYVSDMLEQNRDFEGVEELREAFEKDFEEGFFKCLESTVQFLEKNNKEIYPLTLQAYNYYKRSK